MNELYYYSYPISEKLKCHDIESGITVSNGLAWSPDWTKMYLVDTIAKKVYSFDYNESDASITNQAIVIDYAKDELLGLPDGMTVDSEGKIWVANIGASVVTRWDPNTGEKLGEVPIPSLTATSCCFGGSDYSKLFVTTGLHDAAEADLKHYPHCGALFVVENLGVNGMPPQKFVPVK